MLLRAAAAAVVSKDTRQAHVGLLVVTQVSQHSSLPVKQVKSLGKHMKLSPKSLGTFWGKKSYDIICRPSGFPIPPEFSFSLIVQGREVDFPKKWILLQATPSSCTARAKKSQL